MDSGGSKSGCSASSSFDVAFTSENRFCQDTQLRHRKSPRKRLRLTRTLALVIDQLRNSFQRAGDFTPRMRTRRNWRSEFLMRYLSDNRRGDNEECATVRRGGSCCKSFVRETPRIYSIGLRSCARNFSDDDDLLNALGAIRNFWRHFRRCIVVRKHWVAQSTASSSRAVSLQERANQQARVIDGLKSAEVFKVDEFQERSRPDDQLYERIEEKDCDDLSSTLSNDHVSADRSFTPNFDHSPVRKCCEHDGLRVMRKDAQVQTSSRKTARRKQTVEAPRPTNESILRREHDEPTFRFSVADFRSNFRSWDSTNRNEQSRLSIRFLENKRAEYINKFTAVKRQIEEITATLRETCCSEKSSRIDQENCETYFASTRDHANVNPKQDVNSNEVDDEEDNGMVPVEKKNISQEDDEIIEKSTNDSENVRRILNVNNETPGLSGKKYLKNAIVSTSNLCENPSANDILVCDCMLTMKEMLRPLNETPRSCHKKRAKCRFGKQISFRDQDLRKDDGEIGEFSVRDRSFNEVYLRNQFVAADDENARVSVQDFATSERPRYQRMVVDEKMGEMAILNDIKKRIDRDFDDPSSKSENDTEDFFIVPRKNINFESDSQLYQSITTSTMIVEPQPSLTAAETQTRNSVWADTMSELSNKNSTFSMYHSCTQFPSFVSLKENEDELEAEDRSVIDDGSYLNSHLNIDCYDLNVNSNVDCSRVSSNDFQSNLSFDRPHNDVQGIAQDTSTSECTCPNQFLSEATNESRNARDMFGNQELADKAYCEYPLDESNEKAKESRAYLEQQYTADTTFETSKSSRHIGSIDSGVFVSSSLIDLQAHENSFDGGKPDHERRQRRVKERELHGSSRTFDFSSDNSSGSSSCCTDDTLDRRINDVIRDLTKNLVLCERRVRMKLREMQKAGLRTRETRYSPHSPPRACKFSNIPHDVSYDFFQSPRRSCEDERISGVSTPSFMSLPESEIEDHESIC